MSILYWIAFGLIAGLIANFLSPSFKGGLIKSMLLGIAGAVVGGFLGNLIFGVGVTGFNLKSFAVAVAGSLIVIFVWRLLFGRR